jgi:SP family xylose:H+ symportor-like MFS transporter
VARGRLDEARTVLQRCGSDTSSVEDEILEIQHSMDLVHHSLKEPFYTRRFLRPIMLAVAMGAFNQLSGINAVLYYTPSIFKTAGAGVESALLQSIIIGFTMLVFTMFAMVIIDYFGRRKLMIMGSIGYIIGPAGAAYAFYAKVEGPLLLVSLMVFIAAHGFGQGAVIWVFISEIFPNRVRARGQALGSVTHCAMNAAISWTFPMIASVAGWTAFAFYALCMVGQLVWVILIMPETKGVSLEKIQEKLGIE